MCLYMLIHIRVGRSTHLCQALLPRVPRKASADPPKPLGQQGPHRSWHKPPDQPAPLEPPACLYSTHTHMRIELHFKNWLC